MCEEYKQNEQIDMISSNLQYFYYLNDLNNWQSVAFGSMNYDGDIGSKRKQKHINTKQFESLFNQMLCNTKAGVVINFFVDRAIYIRMYSSLQFAGKMQVPVYSLLGQKKVKNRQRQYKNNSLIQQIQYVKLLRYEQNSEWTIVKVIVHSTDLQNNNYQIVRYLKVSKFEKIRDPNKLLTCLKLKTKKTSKRSIFILQTDFNLSQKQKKVQKAQKVQKIQIEYLPAKQIQTIVQTNFSSYISKDKDILLDEVKLQFDQHKDVVVYILTNISNIPIQIPVHFQIQYSQHYKTKQLLTNLKKGIQILNRQVILNNEYCLAYSRDKKMIILNNQDILPDPGSQNSIVLYYKQRSVFQKINSLGRKSKLIVDLSLDHFGRAFLQKDDIIFIKGTKNIEKCSVINLQKICEQKTVQVKFCNLEDDLQEWMQIGRNNISHTKLITEIIKIKIKLEQKYQQKSIQFYPFNIISFGKGTKDQKITLQYNTVRNLFDLYNQTQKRNQKSLDSFFQPSCIYLYNHIGRKMKIIKMQLLLQQTRKFYFIRQDHCKQHNILFINNIRALNTSIIHKQLFRHIGNLREKQFVGYFYQDSSPKFIQSQLFLSNNKSYIQEIQYGKKQFGYLSHNVPHVFSSPHDLVNQKQYYIEQKTAFIKQQHLNCLYGLKVNSIVYIQGKVLLDMRQNEFQMNKIKLRVSINNTCYHSQQQQQFISYIPPDSYFVITQMENEDQIAITELQKPSLTTRYVILWVDDFPINNMNLIKKIYNNAKKDNKQIEILQCISTEVAKSWIEHFYPYLKKLYPEYCLKIISDMNRQNNRVAGVQLIPYLQQLEIQFQLIFFVSYEDGAKMALHNANKAYDYRVTSEEEDIINWCLFKQQLENLIQIIPSRQIKDTQ